MLVRNRMAPNPITVRRDSDPMAAKMLLRYGKFHRLPVVDENDHLVGIVTAFLAQAGNRINLTIRLKGD